MSIICIVIQKENELELKVDQKILIRDLNTGTLRGTGPPLNQLSYRVYYRIGGDLLIHYRY